MSMEVIEKAIKDKDEFIKIKDNKIIISFQDGTIKEKGIIGLQAVEILEFIKNVFFELNQFFPCPENSLTIDHINHAIDYQSKRTKDRKKRGVEGYNKD